MVGRGTWHYMLGNVLTRNQINHLSVNPFFFCEPVHSIVTICLNPARVIVILKCQNSKLTCPIREVAKPGKGLQRRALQWD